VTQAKCEFGVVGLGRMGGGLALQALEKGLTVAGYSRGGASPQLRQAGLRETESLETLAEVLKPPRAVFLYVPAGSAVDDIIQRLAPRLASGDVLVDGGNSYWGDSVRRARSLQDRELHFVDLGTSGGVDGARNGACFMAGGDRAAVARIDPLLRVLAVPGGYVHAGPSGAGHFTKLVHNGIEFGMLQAIGEGVALLEAYKAARVEDLPIADILRCWRNGSVIRSWLVDLLEDGYRTHRGLEDVPGYVEDTGEVNWLVNDAVRMEVPVPVIAQSVMQLLLSRDQDKPWARAIALMRHGFGGHPFGAAESVAREREEARIGGPP
jgi:6-phosphogluconate dehydrogenase